jgi:hypothetical protein
MVGCPRIIRAAGIIHPVGNPNCERSYGEEKMFRRAICQKALEALTMDVGTGGVELLPEVGLVIGEKIIESAP